MLGRASALPTNRRGMMMEDLVNPWVNALEALHVALDNVRHMAIVCGDTERPKQCQELTDTYNMIAAMNKKLLDMGG